MGTRQPHDPFTDAPPRPTTSNQASSLPANPLLRTQTSQHSLRSNTSSTSARPRPAGRDLFAPSLTRRGTTPRFEDGVLADSDSEQDVPASSTQRHRQQTRRVRHGSPDAKYARGKSRQDEEDFVNRKADGNYLLGVAGFGETLAVPQMSVVKTDEEVELDAAATHDLAISRQYFASGAALGGKRSKKYDEELEQLRLPMMARLRQKVMQQLEDERWMYES